MIQRLHHLQTITRGLENNSGVALLGPRQCGKTTLARQVALDQGAKFFDLEHPRDSAALENPLLALESLRGLVVLDEVQRKPELFPVLRVLMDRPNAPAKFLLLGSASPFLVRGVTESLAGRVQFLDLQGFNMSEVGGGEQEKLWTRGGFPRAFLAKDDAASFQWRRDFIRTFIEKDFATLGVGLTPSSLGRLWQMTAHSHGQTLNASELGRSLGQTYKTVQRHLELLEGAFMVRILKPWFENVGKRVAKASKIYVRDCGLLHALLGITNRDGLLGHPKLAASWEGFAMEQICDRLAGTDAWYWGTQGGAELDLFVQPGGQRVGFEFKVSDAPTMTKSIAVAVEDLKLDRLIVVKPLGAGYQLSPKVEVMSLNAALTACDAMVG